MGQRALLLRLRIKRDDKTLADAVEWNFGVCPRERWFDDLCEKVSTDKAELNKLE